MTSDARQFCRLLLRAPNWLGDSILAMPAVDALRQALPNAHIAVMARHGVADLWRMAPVDQVLPFACRSGIAGLRDRMAFARTVCAEAFDAVLILPNSFDAALVPLLARIPERAGWATDCRSLLLTRRIRRPAHLKASSQSHLYVYLVQEWLGRLLHARDDVRLRVPDDAMRRVRDARSAMPPLVVGINPGATYGAAKCWLPERYAEVALRAHTNFGAHAILFGGAGDATVCAAVHAHIARLAGGAAPWCINLAGVTTLAELAAWLQESTCLVTNDTGTMHVAAAVGTPVIAIFGPTDWNTTAPIGTQHTLIRVPTDCAPCLRRTCPTNHCCMTAVTTDMVAEAVTELLRANQS